MDQVVRCRAVNDCRGTRRRQSLQLQTPYSSDVDRPPSPNEKPPHARRAQGGLIVSN